MSAGIKNRIGPFHYADGCITFLKKNGTNYAIVLAGAYNAGGLIGSECNGVAVLNQDRMAVVLDGHEPIDSGYNGPSAAQVAEFKRVAKLPGAAFEAFCRSHYRFREGSLGARS